MFAVIKTGGKQYKVSSGDIVKVERLEGDAGSILHLNDVLMLGGDNTVTVGAPFVQDAAVRATILEQARGDKIIVFKKRRRQGYRRKAGHRQDLTVLRIEEVLASGGKSLPKQAAPKKVATKIEVSDEKSAPTKQSVEAKTVKTKASSEEKAKKAPAKKETKN